MNIGKYSFAAAIVMAAVSGAVAQTAVQKIKWIWDDKLDSVTAAPKIHKVLFENDHVRLLEVTVHAGEKEPVHGHKFPSVFMFDAPQPALVNEQTDGKLDHLDRRLTDVELPVCRAAGVQAPHSAKNTDTFEQHFYRMEFKRIDGNSILSKP